MKTKKNRRNFIVMLSIALLMAAMLIGCSSSAEPVKETKTAETVIVKEEATKVAEGEMIEETTSKPTSESTPKSTPKPTYEPIVYEGIDMESTLSGKEWMLTFEGIIDEPKAVLFNDTTNKKIIIENGQKVFYEAGDIFAIYIPNPHMWLSDFSGIRSNGLSSFNNYYNEFTFEKEYLDMVKIFKVVISGKDEPMELEYEFQPMTD